MSMDCEKPLGFHKIDYYLFYNFYINVKTSTKLKKYLCKYKYLILNTNMINICI